MTQAETVSEETIPLRAADGYLLKGRLYRSHIEPRIAVAFHCGAGIAAIRYVRLARMLSQHGLAVLLYDYRGIAWSRPDSLRGFSAKVEDWSEFDVAAATNYLARRFPSASLVGLAHSIGALLLLGAPNTHMLDRMVFIAPHTGYFGDYSLMYRLPMAILWHVLMPALTVSLGYFPGSRLGIGEDIPKGVAMQWASRRSPNLLGGREGDRAARLIGAANRLCTTTLIVTASDDAFATPAGVRRLLGWARNLQTETWTIRPSDVGLGTLGHFGFFSQAASSRLWPSLLAYLLHPSSSRVPA